MNLIFELFSGLFPNNFGLKFFFNYYGGDYMIPTCRDEISTRPAETDFTHRLHVEIKFCPGKAEQFSTWYLIRFVCIFFGFFL